MYLLERAETHLAAPFRVSFANTSEESTWLNPCKGTIPAATEEEIFDRPLSASSRPDCTLMSAEIRAASL